MTYTEQQLTKSIRTRKSTGYLAQFRFTITLCLKLNVKLISFLLQFARGRRNDGGLFIAGSPRWGFAVIVRRCSRATTRKAFLYIQ
jgi:hypothetical protein